MPKPEDFFHDRLRNARTAKGLSQTAFAHELGLSGHAQVSRYEQGKSQPDVATLARIGQVLGVDLHWLITGESSPTVVSRSQESARLIVVLAEYVVEKSSRLLPQWRDLQAKVEAAEEAVRRGQPGAADLLALHKERLAHIAAQLEQVTADHKYIHNAVQVLLSVLPRDLGAAAKLLDMYAQTQTWSTHLQTPP